MYSDLDLIIIGGGCAGLSLANRLSALGEASPKVLILEQRKNYSNDRTWCFWDIENPEYKSLSDHQWSAFKVVNNKHSNEYDCSQNAYLMLNSLDFYEDALANIQSNSNIQLKLGQEVQSDPIKTEHGWQIKTSNLELTSKLVVDTRPPKKIGDHDSLLWQSFVGYEIQTQSNCFSPQQMVLMDFDETFEEGLAFIYILPTEANRALIEYTVFSEKMVTKDQLITRLKKSIHKNIDESQYDVLRIEHGALPMGNKLAMKSKDSSYLFAGLFAGAARPSSGYAFQRIQSWAKSCAESIASNNTLCAMPNDRWLQSFMDGLFLNVIKRNPTKAASLFEHLFKKCELKSVVKFMSDKASFNESLQIIFALPPAPFIKALPHFLFQKIRHRIRLI
ncbi:MAG: hypothetical protein RL416_232 [Pseudomonadota bacterium]